MTYKGILPYMPPLKEDDAQGRQQLQKYVDDFVSKHMTGAGSWTLLKCQHPLTEENTDVTKNRDTDTKDLNSGSGKRQLSKR